MQYEEEEEERTISGVTFMDTSASVHLNQYQNHTHTQTQPHKYERCWKVLDPTLFPKSDQMIIKY